MTDQDDTRAPSPGAQRRPNGLEPALPPGVDRDPRGRLVAYTADGDLLIAAADEDGCLEVGVSGGRSSLPRDDADRLVAMILHVREWGTYDPQAKERRVVRP